jgi:hypothetical protein
MSRKGPSGIRIFLQYWLLIAVMGAFNFYQYGTTKNILSLVVAIICSLVFIGWVLFYYFYVRKKAE